ncbi:MAG: polysaccharide biosynthesis/export family protein [Prevotella sp.]|nr:polysaccharide biosynthesis/export family protein [Prevotella sp.]
MKKILISLVTLAAILIISSCGSTKQVAYFKNIDTLSLEASKGLYDARIMPKDMLEIIVSTIEPAAATPFIMSIPNNGVTGAANQQSFREYLVDNSGNINFPVVGKIHVQGLTKSECQDRIREAIMPYMAKTENPIVTVKMASFRVTVIGEVGGSRVIPVTTEKMSIIEALASAGDLSIYGKRQNVLLIREDATGKKHHVRLDLTDANILNSPYYYLQQNDIIYVEPNSVKKQGASIGPSTTLWFSFIGIATSLTSLLFNVLRN